MNIIFLISALVEVNSMYFILFFCFCFLFSKKFVWHQIIIGKHPVLAMSIWDLDLNLKKKWIKKYIDYLQIIKTVCSILQVSPSKTEEEAESEIWAQQRWIWLTESLEIALRLRKRTWNVVESPLQDPIYRALNSSRQIYC